MRKKKRYAIENRYRRKRYATDPEYRAKVLMAQKARAERRNELHRKRYHERKLEARDARP